MTRTTASTLLLLGGVVLLIAGGVNALKMKAQAESTAAIQGLVRDAQPDYTGALVAAVVAVLGAVMLIAFLVVRSVRPAES